MIPGPDTVTVTTKLATGHAGPGPSGGRGARPHPITQAGTTVTPGQAQAPGPGKFATIFNGLTTSSTSDLNVASGCSRFTTVSLASHAVELGT